MSIYNARPISFDNSFTKKEIIKIMDYEKFEGHEYSAQEHFYLSDFLKLENFLVCSTILGMSIEMSCEYCLIGNKDSGSKKNFAKFLQPYTRMLYNLKTRHECVIHSNKTAIEELADKGVGGFYTQCMSNYNTLGLVYLRDLIMEEGMFLSKPKRNDKFVVRDDGIFLSSERFNKAIDICNKDPNKMVSDRFKLFLNLLRHMSICKTNQIKVGIKLYKVENLGLDNGIDRAVTRMCSNKGIEV